MVDPRSLRLKEIFDEYCRLEQLSRKQAFDLSDTKPTVFLKTLKDKELADMYYANKDAFRSSLRMVRAHCEKELNNRNKHNDGDASMDGVWPGTPRGNEGHRGVSDSVPAVETNENARKDPPAFSDTTAHGDEETGVDCADGDASMATTTYSMRNKFKALEVDGDEEMAPHYTGDDKERGVDYADGDASMATTTFSMRNKFKSLEVDGDEEMAPKGTKRGSTCLGAGHNASMTNLNSPRPNSITGGDHQNRTQRAKRGSPHLGAGYNTSTTIVKPPCPNSSAQGVFRNHTDRVRLRAKHPPTTCLPKNVQTMKYWLNQDVDRLLVRCLIKSGFDHKSLPVMKLEKLREDDVHGLLKLFHGITCAPLENNYKLSNALKRGMEDACVDPGNQGACLQADDAVKEEKASIQLAQQGVTSFENQAKFITESLGLELLRAEAIVEKDIEAFKVAKQILENSQATVKALQENKVVTLNPMLETIRALKGFVSRKEENLELLDCVRKVVPCDRNNDSEEWKAIAAQVLENKLFSSSTKIKQAINSTILPGEVQIDGECAMSALAPGTVGMGEQFQPFHGGSGAQAATATACSSFHPTHFKVPAPTANAPGSSHPIHVETTVPAPMASSNPRSMFVQGSTPTHPINPINIQRSDPTQPCLGFGSGPVPVVSAPVGTHLTHAATASGSTHPAHVQKSEQAQSSLGSGGGHTATVPSSATIDTFQQAQTEDKSSETASVATGQFSAIWQHETIKAAGTCDDKNVSLQLESYALYKRKYIVQIKSSHHPKYYVMFNDRSNKFVDRKDIEPLLE